MGDGGGLLPLHLVSVSEGIVDQAKLDRAHPATAEAIGHGQGCPGPWFVVPIGRVAVPGLIQSETWTGCIVASTTATSSVVRVLRSTSSRSRALKASRVRDASYFCR